MKFSNKKISLRDKRNLKRDWRGLRDKEENNNLILTENVQISMNRRYSGLAMNNLLVIGGSGSGNTFHCVGPNLLQCNGSYVVNDAHGKLLRTYGNYLVEQGYVIKVLNLANMKESDCYNPFCYIRSEEDVRELINLLIAATPDCSRDPFFNDPWVNWERGYLRVLFYYVWLEYPPERRNFKALAELLDTSLAALDQMLADLARQKGGEHPAVREYRAISSCVPKTLQKYIFAKVSNRMARFKDPELLRILAADDMDIPSLGLGKDRDKETKTALFCVLPSAETTYNFVSSMLYAQIFRELNNQADDCFRFRLPIPVIFWLDEAETVLFSDNYPRFLADGCRRGISANLIVHSISNLKSMFPDRGEAILDNFSTLLYLGGSDPSSHSFVWEMSDHWLTINEVCGLSREKAIFIKRGKDDGSIRVATDQKYPTMRSKKYQEAVRLGPYRHPVHIEKDKKQEPGHGRPPAGA